LTYAPRIPKSDELTGAELVAAMPDGPMIGTGRRNQMRQMAYDLAIHAKEYLLEKWATPERMDVFTDVVWAGAKERDRTCLNIVANAYKLMGKETMFVVALWERLGVSGEGEVKSKLERMKAADGASPQESAERCLELVCAVADLDPDFKATAIRRLGGMVPIA